MAFHTQSDAFSRHHLTWLELVSIVSYLTFVWGEGTEREETRGFRAGHSIEHPTLCMKGQGVKIPLDDLTY